MLFIPEGPTKYHVCGIDPGTTSLGLSVISYDIRTTLKRVELSITLNAAKSMGKYSPVIETNGERFARLISHKAILVDMFSYYKPNRIVSESPYLSRFPQAFAALTECLFMIEEAVRCYDFFISLEKIDPATAKTLVGVSGKSKDKEDMRRALQALSDLDWGFVNSNVLDEHSIDSLAIAYGKLNSLLNDKG